LSLELHNVVFQQLIGLKIALENLAHHSEHSEKLMKIQYVVNHSAEEIRALSHEKMQLTNVLTNLACRS